jgi:signal transduction histidine kinase
MSVRIATLAGSYVLAAAVLGLAGWVFDIRRLTDWDANGISIQPNSTVVAMAVALGILLRVRGAERAGRLAGGAAAAITSATLLQYLFGVDFRIDRLLLFDREWGDRATVVHGRMGPAGATSWTLLGIALVLAPTRSPLRRYAPRLAIGAIAIASISLTGYFFQAQPLYVIPWLTAIALQTSTMILAGAIGILATLPDLQPMRLLRDPGVAGLVTRRSLPFLVGAPFSLGALSLSGHRAGLYDAALATAFFALGLIALTVIALWRIAAALAEVEREQLRAQAAEREADRRKDVFLATLAHELRNPLAPIANSLEVLKRAGSEPAVQEPARATMERQLARLVRLVDDLLDVSRITRDAVTLRRERVDVAALVRDAVEAARPAAAEAGLHLGAVFSPTPIETEADPARIVQVLSNLLDNACKYGERGGRIEVAVEQGDGEIAIRVSDTGIGIAVEHRDAIFEMFRQVDESLERRRGGLGIGLALSRRLIELHGGTLRAESGGVGTGSTFMVRLPALGEATSIAPSPLPTPIAPSRRRILVVDDHEDSAVSLAKLLELAGHETWVAHDGDGAIACAARERPEVIVLDIGMPDRNGYDVCRAIRAESWGAAITMLALTGWGQEQDRERARDAGFDAHLVKPVDFGALNALLAREK